MKRIIRIDASSLKSSACPLAWHRIVVDGYREDINNNDIEFGTAVHIFLQTMCKSNGNFAIAIREAQEYFTTTKMTVKPIKKYLDAHHLSTVCIQYWTWLTQRDDFDILLNNENVPTVEVTFSNLIYESETLEVRFEGTIDKLGKFKNGCYALGDYKTHSPNAQFRDAKDRFLDSFELSTQLKFYWHNLHLFARLNPDSLIAEICKHQVGCFIDGIFLQGKDLTEFQRSRIFLFKKEQMELYSKLLMNKVNKFISLLESNAAPEPEGMVTDTCTSGWGCKFHLACGAPDDRAMEHILKRNFVQRPYEPLLFQKKKPAVNEPQLVTT